MILIYLHKIADDNLFAFGVRGLLNGHLKDRR